MKSRPLYVDLIILALLVAAVLLIITGSKQAVSPLPATPTAQVGASEAAHGPQSASASSTSAIAIASSSPKIAEKPNNRATISASTTPEAARISDPYPTPPLSFADVNARARAAIVNIYCVPRGDGMRPISGSGVIIDPRGIILTNAHVAQYVLLSEVVQLQLSCFVRSGSPASGNGVPEVLYIPPAWVEAHAKEIRQARPLGTGEHDYALLYIAATADNTPLPSSFPFVPYDAREAIGFVGDQVLAASYPAEFLGAAATNNLSAASTITEIRQLLTFSTTSVDAISVGGIIEAQSGSSGGAIVNAWGRLIGIITTTSEGPTTSDRDLRAVALSYIDRDLHAQSGSDLASFLARNPREQLMAFTASEGQQLAQLLVDQLSQ